MKKVLVRALPVVIVCGYLTSVRCFSMAQEAL